MSPLPTMSLRVAPEHQALIRAIARALKDSPTLAVVLRDVLQHNTPHDAIQRHADDNVLQNMLQRIADLERRLTAIEASPEACPANNGQTVDDDERRANVGQTTDNEAGDRRQADDSHMADNDDIPALEIRQPDDSQVTDAPTPVTGQTSACHPAGDAGNDEGQINDCHMADNGGDNDRQTNGSRSPDEGGTTGKPVPLDELDKTLCQGTGKGRRLTDHGRRVLADLVAAGISLTEIAARFGMRRANVVRATRTIQKAEGGQA